MDTTRVVAEEQQVLPSVIVGSRFDVGAQGRCQLVSCYEEELTEQIDSRRMDGQGVRTAGT
jgi:hypothetical protein